MRLRSIAIVLCLIKSVTGFSQDFSIQAKPIVQSIDAFKDSMDQGAHAIHLEVRMDENKRPILSSGILLSDVIKALEWHTKSYTRYEIRYVIELVRSPDYVLESKTIHDLIDQYIPMKRITIQSEDFRILKYWKKNYPEIELLAFINNNKSVDTNLANLGFKPTIYSPKNETLTENIINNLHKRSIKVIPWLVNDTTSMKELITWQADGIITNALDQAELLGLNQEVKNGN